GQGFCKLHLVERGMNDLGSSIYLTHALFGVCQTWIAHGKKESSQEITDFLMKMLGDTN
ncbi:TetR-like C-terminal domain-containing protein, partial [Streptococcus pneumoniae]|uniref:TetR-like C-terminal domain-containing protein n=2 Tax=Streptococcus pneumoniae TaxID=1313 RepID=UPI00186B5AAA